VKVEVSQPISFPRSSRAWVIDKKAARSHGKKEGEERRLRG
jgi:hypothetical protein